MLRSLYAGISGLRAEQTMLDVTGNNIANVNTTGFKGSSVQFQDTLSQTMSAAGLATTSKGGVNPNQVGLGVRVGEIKTNLTQGSQLSTGNNLDSMISGDGYFVTKLGQENLYSRNGSMHWDSAGRLAMADGSLVQGWTGVSGAISTGVRPSSVTLPTGTMAPAVTTTQAKMLGNLPSDAAVGTSFIREIPVYLSDGKEQSLSVTFTAAASGVWNYSAQSGSGTATTGSLNTGAATVTAGGGGTLTPTVASGSGNITLDLSKISGYAGISTATFDSQNGQRAGTLVSTTMGADGTLSGTFSNGATVSLARLALAVFSNAGGLEKAGSSSFRESINSGRPTLNTAGSDGFGSVVSGALEASNVDLSQEFTNLIVAQRGFQASARIITTSDEMLQELTQLKR